MQAATALAPDGRVFVRGEYWNARADEEILADARIEVAEVDGLTLRVRPASER